MKQGRENQPLNRIEWVHRDDLHANGYNPNHVAKPELELLKVSILEDGWTQPIVARPVLQISLKCGRVILIGQWQTDPSVEAYIRSHRSRSSPIRLVLSTEKDVSPSATDASDSLSANPSTTEATSCATGLSRSGALGGLADKTQASAPATTGTLTGSTMSITSSPLAVPTSSLKLPVRTKPWVTWSVAQAESAEVRGRLLKTQLLGSIGENTTSLSQSALEMGAHPIPSCFVGACSACGSHVEASLSTPLEIVDGFHRWTVSADPRIYAMTAGYVPVVRLVPPATGDQMLSTIRHNRARGEHGVLPMAAIVRRLRDEGGLSVEAVMQRCGMEKEEVTRLYERGGMTERGTQGKEGFSKGWTPTRS